MFKFMQGILDIFTAKRRSCGHDDLDVHLVLELQNAVSAMLISSGSSLSEEILPACFHMYGIQVGRCLAHLA